MVWLLYVVCDVLKGVIEGGAERLQKKVYKKPPTFLLFSHGCSLQKKKKEEKKNLGDGVQPNSVAHISFSGGKGKEDRIQEYNRYFIFIFFFLQNQSKTNLEEERFFSQGETKKKKTLTCKKEKKI